MTHSPEPTPHVIHWFGQFENNSGDGDVLWIIAAEIPMQPH